MPPLRKITNCQLFLGALLATGVAYVLPPVYESTAKILVESPKIPTSLAQSTVTVSALERLQTIQQRILARENVLDVIERLNLFADQPELTPTEKVDRIRAGTRIDIIAFNSAAGRRASRNAPVTVSSFTITYRPPTKDITARVANELVTRVLELNLQARSDQAQQTHDFFTQEVERYAADLIAIETEIANYKNQNEGSAPNTLQSRQGLLQGVIAQLFNNKQQQEQLQQQLATLKETLRTLRSLPTPTQNLTQEERQLAALKAQLTVEEPLLTDAHPTVKQLRQQIAAMEKVVSGSGSQTNSSSSAQTLQITNLEGQIKHLQEQEARDSERKVKLEASIADTPRVEMAMNAFNRRHDDLRIRYQAAVNKQAAAATGEKLELDQKAERFELIEQARIPLAPVAPKRTLIAAGGAFVALGAGFALALLLEILSSAIRTSADLQRTVQLRPMVIVPYIYTPAERQKRRFVEVFAVLLFIVVLPSSIWLVDQYVLPIEKVSETVMKKNRASKGLAFDQSAPDLRRVRWLNALRMPSTKRASDGKPASVRLSNHRRRSVKQPSLRMSYGTLCWRPYPRGPAGCLVPHGAWRWMRNGLRCRS